MNQHPGDRFISVEQFGSALSEVAGAGTQAAGAAPRETLKPLGDLDVTPQGGGGLTPMPATRRTPASRDSGRAYGALTRQFFEDGNRMSEEASMAARLRPIDSSLSLSASAMRIPTSAGRKAAVLLAAAAVIGVVAVAWAGVWNPILAVRTHSRTLFSRPDPVAKTAPSPLQAPAEPAPAASPAPAPTPPRAPAVARSATAPVVVPVERSAASASAPANPAEPTLAERQASSSHPSHRARPAAKWSDPLHGYVWSPTERRLVPADRAPDDTSPFPSPSPSSSQTPSPSSPPSLSPPPMPAPPITATPPSFPSTATPPAGPAMSSPLLDLPLPLSSTPTQPPPQPAPPIIDDNDNAPPPPARPNSGH
jgi:hypothetical protein